MADALPNGSLQEQMELLRQAYAARLQGRLRHIQEIWQGLQHGPWDVDGLDTLHRMAHTVAGSGATFGYASLGTAARELEIALKALQHQQPESAEADRITILVQALRAHGDGAGRTLPALRHQVPDVSEAELPEGQPLNRLVILLTVDAEMAADLTAQLANFAYTVRLVASDAALSDAMLADPAAVIVDLDQPVTDLPPQGVLPRHQQRSDRPVPVIFLSSNGDLQARLQAVRHGGDAYFTKPLDTNVLIEKIDNLTAYQTPEPYRVLIVDDEPEMAALLSLMLQQAGMVTEMVHDPLLVQQPLVDFRPDLVLMDINMPGCTGIELAAVIRQQEAYFSIPIVFASTESNALEQLAAVRLAGDDFMIKPVQPEHLVSSVTARAQRSRTLRSLMVRDSLTGLINHTQVRQQLYIEAARSRRTHSALPFAVIDIDNFRDINRAFGHPVGDRMLRSLSLLLQQRLRKTDVIGRYGGQQFAIILPGAAAEAAGNVLDDLRLRFGAIRHRAGDRGFTGTISCGVGILVDDGEADSVSEAALQALAQAKAAGRNRVVVSSP